jgi:class 3 adenylate cyclase
MEADEAGTLERLKENRSRLRSVRRRARWALVKLMGDGALVEFASVVAAVECASRSRSEPSGSERSPDEARIRYRIGINIGEVIVEATIIYGEGVNVAARLQALARSAVAIPSAVRDQVAGSCVARSRMRASTREEHPASGPRVSRLHSGRDRPAAAGLRTRKTPRLCDLLCCPFGT